MLVLTRKSNQSIMIGDDIEVSVLSIMGEKVRIGIQAPRDIPVFRKEVYLEIQQENVAAGASARQPLTRIPELWLFRADRCGWGRDRRCFGGVRAVEGVGSGGISLYVMI